MSLTPEMISVFTFASQTSEKWDVFIYISLIIKRLITFSVFIVHKLFFWDLILLLLLLVAFFSLIYVNSLNIMTIIFFYYRHGKYFLLIFGLKETKKKTQKLSKDRIRLPITYGKLTLVVYFYNFLKSYIKGCRGIKKE